MKTRIGLCVLACLVAIWIVIEPILLRIGPLEVLRIVLIWLDIPFAAWLAASLWAERRRRAARSRPSGRSS